MNELRAIDKPSKLTRSYLLADTSILYKISSVSDCLYSSPFSLQRISLSEVTSSSSIPNSKHKLANSSSPKVILIYYKIFQCF